MTKVIIKKRKVGRQPIEAGEKKEPVTIWVKNKFKVKATVEASKIEKKYG